MGEFFKLNKNIKIKLAVSFLAACAMSVASFSTLGKKNSVLLFVSLFLTSFALSMLDDRKKSMLVFIVSLPLLVTGRKFFYVDFLIFKLSFESVYITALFVVCAKDIWKELKGRFQEKIGDFARMDYLLYALVFIVLAYYSTMFSIDAPRSLRLLFISVVIPILFMLCIIVTFKRQDIKMIIYAMILQCSFSTIYGFFQIAKLAYADQTIAKIATHRMQYTFGYHNLNIYAAIAILIIPLIFERILYHKNTKAEKIFLFGTGLINVAGIVSTFTRGAWLMLLVGVAMVFISKKYKKVVYAGIVLGIIGLKPVLSFIMTRGTTASDMLTNESLLGRVVGNLSSLRMIFEYPFGIGAGNYAEIFKKFSIKGYYLLPYDFRTNINVPSYNLEHAHNLFLQIGSELGLITLVIFILILWNRMKFAFKNFSTQRGFAAALLVHFTYTVVTGGELEHKGVITGTLLMWLVFAMLYINGSKDTEEKDLVTEVK